MKGGEAMGKVKDYLILVEDLEKRMTELEKRVQSLVEFVVSKHDISRDIARGTLSISQANEMLGIKITLECPSCKTLNYTTADYCGDCGNKLSTNSK